MGYATLMVQLELGRSNTGLLKIAGSLAERFHAHVIGIAACQPLKIVYTDGYVSGELIEESREELDRETRTAEAEFRNALQAQAGSSEWRSAVTLLPLADYFAREARNADLIITGSEDGSLLDTSRRIGKGDLLMQAGRPVLIVPPAAENLQTERATIGWKDTRETRRAALDALPLLKIFAHVTVAEIAAKDEMDAAARHVKDVVSWLARHGITAEPHVSRATGDDSAQLAALTRDADLIVAGAYGHSRLREWVLGGVTRDLLLHANRCSLVSH